MSRQLVIDGNAIYDRHSFYRQLDKCLVEGQCPLGENLDSLDENVTCFFNYTGNEALDLKEIAWNDADLSKSRLGNELFDKLVEILSGNTEIRLQLK